MSTFHLALVPQMLLQPASIGCRAQVGSAAGIPGHAGVQCCKEHGVCHTSRHRAQVCGLELLAFIWAFSKIVAVSVLQPMNSTGRTQKQLMQESGT